MFELSLGFILAAIFVAAYLLIVKLFNDERQEIRGKVSSVFLNPVNTERAIGAGQVNKPLLPESAEKQDRY